MNSSDMLSARRVFYSRIKNRNQIRVKYLFNTAETLLWWCNTFPHLFFLIRTHRWSASVRISNISLQQHKWANIQITWPLALLCRSCCVEEQITWTFMERRAMSGIIRWERPDLVMIDHLHVHENKELELDDRVETSSWCWWSMGRRGERMKASTVSTSWTTTSLSLCRMFTVTLQWQCQFTNSERGQIDQQLINSQWFQKWNAKMDCHIYLGTSALREQGPSGPKVCVWHVTLVTM